MVRKKIGMIIATFILLMFSVFLLIFFGNKAKTQTLEYEAVEVNVISAEKVLANTYGRSHRNKVIVEYEGIHYELQSVKDLEMVDYEIAANAQNAVDTDSPGLLNINGYMSNGRFYSNDTTATVYLYNGKLYSNEDGIRTNNPAHNWRQVGLWGTYIFGIWHLLCVASLIDKKMKLKKELKQEIGGN